MRLTARKGDMMLTPEAQRAGRALLGWGVRELAAAAGVSWTTISQFENGRPLRDSTSAKVVAALEAEGVELVADENRTGAVLVYARRRGGGDGGN
jgi:transcriptional regulator with XRE-family HTH domain